MIDVYNLYVDLCCLVNCFGFEDGELVVHNVDEDRVERLVKIVEDRMLGMGSDEEFISRNRRIADQGGPVSPFEVKWAVQALSYLLNCGPVPYRPQAELSWFSVLSNVHLLLLRVLKFLGGQLVDVEEEEHDVDTEVTESSEAAVEASQEPQLEEGDKGEDAGEPLTLAAVREENQIIDLVRRIRLLYAEYTFGKEERISELDRMHDEMLHLCEEAYRKTVAFLRKYFPLLECFQDYPEDIRENVRRLDDDLVCRSAFALSYPSFLDGITEYLWDHVVHCSADVPDYLSDCCTFLAKLTRFYRYLTEWR